MQNIAGLSFVSKILLYTLLKILNSENNCADKGYDN